MPDDLTEIAKVNVSFAEAEVHHVDSAMLDTAKRMAEEARRSMTSAGPSTAITIATIRSTRKPSVGSSGLWSTRAEGGGVAVVDGDGGGG